MPGGNSTCSNRTRRPKVHNQYPEKHEVRREIGLHSSLIREVGHRSIPQSKIRILLKNLQI